VLLVTIADALLTAFSLAAAGLLACVVVYPLLLVALLLLRHRRPARVSLPLPRVAVVVPTLNEEQLIRDKLEDLARTRYPQGLLSICVVDGGSRDRTCEHVRSAIAAGQRIRLLEMERSRGKIDQLRRALFEIDADVIVVTDADSELAPDCVAELAQALRADPRTGLVGAVIHPCSSLREEHLHWKLLNTLWWLEGEALSSAVAPGPCYALRREAIGPLPRAAFAEDLHVAQAVAARGYRVRACRRAHAWERRVPQDAADLLRYRRRRGLVFLHELRRPPDVGASLAHRVVRLVRLSQLVLAPRLALLALAVFPLLLLTAHWQRAVVLAAIALVPLAAGIATAALAAGQGGRAAAALAAARMTALTGVALLTLPRHPAPEDLR
jgi:cellulose synthase/poly-beta-1,6-N-acetylglucosamine synthase-like glycosyltransferase